MLQTFTNSIKFADLIIAGKKLSISVGTLRRECADLSWISGLEKPAVYIAGEENRTEFGTDSVKRLNFRKVRHRFTSPNCLTFFDAATMQFATGNGSTLRRRIRLSFKRTGEEYRAHVERDRS